MQRHKYWLHICCLPGCTLARNLNNKWCWELNPNTLIMGAGSPYHVNHIRQFWDFFFNLFLFSISQFCGYLTSTLSLPLHPPPFPLTTVPCALLLYSALAVLLTPNSEVFQTFWSWALTLSTVTTSAHDAGEREDALTPVWMLHSNRLDKKKAEWLTIRAVRLQSLQGGRKYTNCSARSNPRESKEILFIVRFLWVKVKLCLKKKCNGFTCSARHH